MFQSFADAPLRGASTPEKPNGFSMRRSAAGGKGEPYVVPIRPRRRGSKDVGNRMQTSQNFMWGARMMAAAQSLGARVAADGTARFQAAQHGWARFDWPSGTRRWRRIRQGEQLVGISVEGGNRE